MALRLTRKSCPALVAATLLAATVATGCGDDTGTGESTATTPTGPAVTSAPPEQDNEDEAVTPQASQQLCDMVGSEIDTWRDLGPVPARVAFNGTVQNWAARNDGLNDEVIQDTGLVDTVTAQTCPDVRDRALEVLDTETLASALAGFGE
ncbi:hypothetical protein [Nocardia carnea]|uniref:hypothetical protein n=1 Tax=Nocardia carnea TaxID=37328 RepID=UPI002453B133|nr:hypothetical protein [Nocardia carnea]